MFFTGSYGVSIDDKGRLAVPAPFRQLLTRSDALPLYVLPVTHNATEPHLEVYPAPKFMDLVRQIDENPNRRDAEMLKRVVVGRSVMIELDAQGRVVLPQKLRDEVRINGRAVVMGQSARFEIWDEELLNARPVDIDALSAAFESLHR